MTAETDKSTWEPEKTTRKHWSWNVAHRLKGVFSQVRARCMNAHDAQIVSNALNADAEARELGYGSALDAIRALRDYEAINRQLDILTKAELLELEEALEAGLDLGLAKDTTP